MSYLKNKITGAVTENLDEDSFAFQTLVKMRTTQEEKVKGTGGFGTGSGGEYTIPKESTIWEAVAQQDAGFPDPAGGRVGIVLMGSIAAGSTEISDDEFEPPVLGKITSAVYVPLTTVEKNASNYRTITLYEWRNKEKVLTETAPQEKVVLAKIETKAASATGLAANAMTVEASAEIKGGTTGEPGSLQVESKPTGAGVADPGGLVYVVYTRV